MFTYFKGNSGARYDDADVIHGFNASTNTHVVWDKLDFAVAGTSTNFGHIKGQIDTSDDSTFEQDFNQAMALRRS